jgi:hypothetical protein
MSAIPFRMVVETPMPPSVAPAVSKTTASTHAFLTVSALEPTEVA